ncbi:MULTISPECIES: hypothetical protein [unclassified Phyllobacterium]
MTKASIISPEIKRILRNDRSELIVLVAKAVMKSVAISVWLA